MKTVEANNDAVTITGLTVAKPLFAIHRTNKITVDEPIWVYIRATAGTICSRSVSYHHYCIGTYHNSDIYDSGGANCATFIPTATSCTFSITNIGNKDSSVFFYQ